MSDPYKVLGITREATDDEVKKAYRSMSKKYHPDANINNPNKEKAEEMFKLVQEAYQQIIYERQHPYASQGTSGSGTYGSSGNNGSGNAYYSGQNMNGQFYTSWEDFFNDFFTGAFTGQYQHAGPAAAETEEDRYYRAAANYINNRHYTEAINVLNLIENHSAMWYYYSAIAYAGNGNHAQALEFATIAADMEPNNYSYQNLVTQLRGGSARYQDQQRGYVQPYNSDGWCIRLCLLNIALNLCCGRGLRCGDIPV